MFDGAAIFNLLKAHPAHITVRIDGVAACMACLIAMVGDEVIMPANAMRMIYDRAPSWPAPPSDMAGTAVMLERSRRA